HEKSHYLRTANPWEPDIVRFERVTQHRREELEEIKRYVEHTGCLMEFLAHSLDDPAAAPCGRCMNCTGHGKRRLPPPSLVQEAIEFLRGDTLILEPRNRWPSPALEEIHGVWPDVIERFENGNPKTTLSERWRLQPGRVLCIWGDAGWGDEI